MKKRIFGAAVVIAVSYTHLIGTDGKSIDYKYAYTDDVLTSIVDAEGNEYRIAFKNGCIEKFTNPMGEETIYKIANNYKSTKVSSFNGSSRTENPYECSYTFNENGQLTLKRDSLGNEFN